MHKRVSKLLSVKKLYFLALVLLVSCAKATPETMGTGLPQEVIETPNQEISPTEGVEQSVPLTPTQPIVPTSNTSFTLTFSIDSANSTLPTDVLREVSFAPAGGGPNCETVDVSPNGLYEAVIPKDGELMDAAVLMICGWQENEVIQVVVKYPNGNEIKKEIIAKSEYGGKPDILYWFIPKISDPAGTYTFTLIGSQQIVSYQASYKSPDGPRAYPILSDSEQEWWDVLETMQAFDFPGMLLFGFKPNEKIRVFAYQTGIGDYYEFVAWQEYQVDPKGQLFISVDIKANIIFVIGESTGEVTLSTYSPYGNLFASSNSILAPDSQEQPNQNVSCPGAPPQRVSVNAQAKVCTKTDSLLIREAPGRSSSVLDRIPPGTIVNIIDGPSCSDNWSWWKIRTEDDRVGWVSEGGDNIDPYFICPIE